jgi:hypothetical protein
MVAHKPQNVVACLGCESLLAGPFVGAFDGTIAIEQCAGIIEAAWAFGLLTVGTASSKGQSAANT